MPTGMGLLPSRSPHPCAGRKGYPHVCVETSSPSRPKMIAFGTSPHMRGYPCLPRRAVSTNKIYPHVCGATATSPSMPIWTSGLSRVYGATVVAAMASTLALGLSPCIRGYRRPSPAAQRTSGSIPVYTGLPARSRGRYLRPRVYPRACGATTNSTGASASDWGLSPRMRGYRHHAPARPLAPGSIPAYAGLPLLQYVREQSFLRIIGPNSPKFPSSCRSSL